MYVAATGKQGGAGRVHDHYEGADATRQGRPDGPFFRLIKAALVLVGDTQSDEAIFEAIQDHTAEVKIEKLTEEVNAAISDDLKATLYAPHKSKEALKKALRDHRTRARKLIDSAKAEEKRLAKRRLPDRAGLTTHSLN
jgi:hypothetical protein